MESNLFIQLENIKIKLFFINHMILIKNRFKNILNLFLYKYKVLKSINTLFF